MPRPRVITHCVADTFANKSRERIIEFTFPSGRGGLLSFSTLDDGAEVIDLYRCDPGFIVRVAREVGVPKSAVAVAV